jgi:CRP-like cAMP-binding protein
MLIQTNPNDVSQLSPTTSCGPSEELIAARSIELFRYLTESELIALLSVSKQRKFEAGEELIVENSIGTETYLILRGKVELFKGRHHFAFFTAGGCFGEMAMFENAPRSASVVAVEPGTLIILSRPALFPLLATNPQLAVKLLWSVCQTLNGRLRKTTEDLADARDHSGSGVDPR